MPNKQNKVIEFSEYDVSSEGMYNWTDVFFKEVVGVRLNIVLGSNEHLDGILDKNLESFLEFY